jgi:pyruvate dehydrogenase E1 component alpha subunit
MARAGEGPTLIEALTYRLGAHSSADDPAHYRDSNDEKAWQKKDPLLRFSIWLDTQKVLSVAAQSALAKRIEADIRAAIAVEEKAGPPALASLFDDVYAKPTWLLDHQRSERLRSR